MDCRVALLVLFLGLAAAAPNSKGSLLTRLNTARTSTSNRLGIYDGQKTTIAKHNYLVSIQEGGEALCAGAIISDSYVLTLGDCPYGYAVDYMTVVAGSNDGTSGTQYKVKSVIIHPNYTIDFDYDFALIQIKGKFSWSSTVGKVSLPSAPPKTNTAFTVAGWGQTSGGDDVSGGSLYQGTMKWVDTATCKRDYSGLEWTDRMGCTYNKGKTTLCVGDWGDAFVKGGRIYALAANGIQNNFCTSKASPILVSNVYSVLDWLNKYIKP